MILVVDDISENVYALKKVLELQSFDVDTAFSGEEALKKMLNKTYTLVILDVQMPDIDGFEVAENIKGFKKAKDTAVIFLSANSIDTSLIIKGYKQGAIDYITKPVDPAVLLMKVKNVYELYATKQRNNKYNQEINDLLTREREQNKTLTQNIENLYEMLQLAKMATWEYYYDSGILNCSPEVYKILHLNPETDLVDVAFVLNHLQPEYKNLSDKFLSEKQFELVHPFNAKTLKVFGQIEYRNDIPYRIKGLIQHIKA